MFITRMALDTNRSTAQQALAAPSLLRAAVDAAFDGEQVHALFRIDQVQHRTYLMLLSPLRPTMAALHESFGILGAFPSWETTYIGDDLENLRPNTTWRFHLCANPGNDPALHLLTPTSVADHKAWLVAQGEENGFRVDPTQFDVLRSEWLTFLPTAEAAAPIMCEQVTYDGLMTVVDANRFVDALISGIGQSTDYGTGLMTLEEAGTFRRV